MHYQPDYCSDLNMSIANIRTDMDSVSMVMEYLKEKGYDSEFTIADSGQLLLKGKLYDAASIRLLKTFRFEGESDPSEQSIIYLIETNDGEVGYSIDSYGMYSEHMDDAYAEFIRKLSA